METPELTPQSLHQAESRLAYLAQPHRRAGGQTEQAREARTHELKRNPERNFQREKKRAKRRNISVLGCKPLLWLLTQGTYIGVSVAVACATCVRGYSRGEAITSRGHERQRYPVEVRRKLADEHVALKHAQTIKIRKLENSTIRCPGVYYADLSTSASRRVSTNVL